VLRKNTYKIYAVFLFFSGILLIPRGWSQNVRVSAHLDTTVIRPGEQTRIHLLVSVAPKHSPCTIHWPSLSDTLIKGIGVLSRSKTDTLRRDSSDKDKTQHLSQTLVITSFDSGYYAIPPFAFYLNNDTSKPMLTEALLIQVEGMKVDTTQSIKDIKKPLNAPFDWHELIPLFKWITLIIAVLILIFLIVFRLAKKRRHVSQPVKKAVPPHLLALQNLEKLREEKLWQNGKTKEYHSRLTDILRLYIEQRFSINALEQTTDEIIRSFRSVPIEPENKSRLKQIFELSDLVKFAKQLALPDENEMSLNNAILFVRETIQAEQRDQEHLKGGN
jgi:hypothetical protein